MFESRTSFVYQLRKANAGPKRPAPDPLPNPTISAKTPVGQRVGGTGPGSCRTGRTDYSSGQAKRAGLRWQQKCFVGEVRQPKHPARVPMPASFLNSHCDNPQPWGTRMGRADCLVELDTGAGCRKSSSDRPLLSRCLYRVNLSRAAWRLTIASLVIGVATWSNARGDLIDHPLFRDGTCHVLDLEAEAFRHIPWQNYQAIAKIAKADVFCLGDVIVVDEVLRTNGGDIVIAASKLVLNSAIDTRPYFERARGVDWFAPRDPGYEEYQNLVKVPERVWHHGVGYLRIYDEYYTSCAECSRVSDSVIAPELPSGLTPAGWQGAGGHDQVWRWIRNGLPPPGDRELDEYALRSGDITVFVRELEIAAALLEGRVGSSDPCVNDELKPRPFAFNAGGARGGRGGLGVPPPCLGLAAGAFRCADELYAWRGVSGPPGAGAAGAAIRFYRVGAPIDQQFAEFVERATSTAGGPGGDRTRRWVPRAGTGPGNWGNGEYVPVCSLESDGQWPAAASGPSGRLSIDSLPNTEAFEAVARLALGRDGRSDFAFGTLLERAATNESIFSEKTMNFLELRLSDAILDALSRVAGSLEEAFSGEGSSTRAFVWEILSGVAPDQVARTAAITPELMNRLEQLRLVDVGRSCAPIRQYFLRLGGAFNLGDPYSHTRFIAEASRIDAGRQLKYTPELLRELNKVSGYVAELMIITRQAQLESRLQLARNMLAAAKMEADRTGSSGLAGIVADLGRAIGAVERVAAAIGSSDPAAAAAQFPDAMRAIQAALGAMASIEGRSDNVALHANVRAAERALDEFLVLASSIRDDVLRRHRRYLIASLFERESYRSKLAARISLVPELLRLTVLSFAADSARSIADARSNAIAVKTFAAKFPREEPAFRFRAIQNPFFPERNRVRPAPTWRVIEVELPTNPSVSLPAYVLAPTIRPLYLPMFGLKHRVGDFSVEVDCTHEGRAQESRDLQ